MLACFSIRLIVSVSEIKEKESKRLRKSKITQGAVPSTALGWGVVLWDATGCPRQGAPEPFCSLSSISMLFTENLIVRKPKDRK